MKVIFFANTDWYLFNYRLPLARALKLRGDDVLLLSPAGRYSHTLEKEGFRWMEFRLERKGMNPFAELLTILRLADVFRNEKPDLVHLFTIKPVLYGSVAAHLSGVRRIVNAITGLGFVFSDAGSYLRGLVLGFYKISMRGTRVIFQNPDDQDVFLKNRLITPEQAALIPGSGVDVQIFTPIDEPTGTPVIMLAGRLLRSKGLPEFVEAAKRIHTQGISARFAVVGEPYPDNPDSIRAEELMEWEKQGAIESWGWHDDMAEVISKANLICLPTKYNEGLPRLLVEAGASGRAVIATDIPGCRMVVRDGENGFLVPTSDVDALVSALLKLITDPDLRRKMGKRGREIVEEEFSVNRVIARTIEVYNQFEN